MSSYGFFSMLTFGSDVPNETCQDTLSALNKQAETAAELAEAEEKIKQLKALVGPSLGWLSTWGFGEETWYHWIH